MLSKEKNYVEKAIYSLKEKLKAAKAAGQDDLVKVYAEELARWTCFPMGNENTPEMVVPVKYGTLVAYTYKDHDGDKEIDIMLRLPESEEEIDLLSARAHENGNIELLAWGNIWDPDDVKSDTVYKNEILCLDAKMASPDYDEEEA